MLKQFFIDFLNEGKRILLEDIVSIIPDLVGYTALISGALIILSPMANRSIIRPLGLFGITFVVGASILGAS
ncbi:hypothetical protein [Lysinibacillus fusiformis]|uniref:hypothetical protein n=1 Tax=Lysinibacillus fusiformis TaxID=28031 RepID=UPI0030191AE8